MYASVVSRESVRIVFLYAALNGLDVFSANICNAYLQAPSSRKDYVICRAEFGIANIGCVGLIHRALYGGITARKNFRNHLQSCMHYLKFSLCLADPDVWMQPAEKLDGTAYYEFVLLYVDDALVISKNAEEILMEAIGKYFELKEESIGRPSLYLGGHVHQVKLDNGVDAWSFSLSQYIQTVVKNVEEWLSKRDDGQWRLPTKAETPMRSMY